MIIRHIDWIIGHAMSYILRYAYRRKCAYIDSTVYKNSCHQIIITITSTKNIQYCNGAIFWQLKHTHNRLKMNIEELSKAIQTFAYLVATAAAVLYAYGRFHK